MDFAAIKLDVYRRTGHASSPASDVSTRIGAFVNRWHRQILSKPGMGGLRRVTITKASVANQATYGVALQKLKYVTEATTDRRLREKTLGWYREHVPDPTAWTGTPLHFVPMGYSRIHTRPANASELFVKSTSASDTGTAYVEVVRSDGYTRSLSVAMTGTTAVSLGAAITDAVDVQDFYVSAAAVGTITLHEDSGAGVELSRIPIGQKAGRFLRYALVPTPSSVVTYTLDGEAPIVDLANDTDEPFPNPDFHDLLVDGAVHDEWQSRGRSRDAASLAIDIEQRIRELRMSILEWPEDDEAQARTFDESINLPVK